MISSIAVAQEDIGRFVTIYFDDEGKKDGVLLSYCGGDDYRVWFPHTQNEEGGVGSDAIVDSDQIVALGPFIAVQIPLF